MKRKILRALYFPDFLLDENTLKKAILLFDEIHVTDRPSFSFQGKDGGGQYGTIGAHSPLRRVEQSFRDNGVPLYVHGTEKGYLAGNALEEVHADINDVEYVKLFQRGLLKSEPFNAIQIAKGNYGEFGSEVDVRRHLTRVNIDEVLVDFENLQALFYDPEIPHMDLSTVQGRAKSLIAHVATCATMFNQAIHRSASEGFTPFSDARPYGHLLGQKYTRAGEALKRADGRVSITDLSFAVLDEIVPNDVVSKLSIRDAVAHRKSEAASREAFLEQLGAIHAKMPNLDNPEAYERHLQNVIEGEVRPAARKYRNALSVADDRFKVKLGQGLLGVAAGGGLINLFSNVGWASFLPLAAAGSAYVGSAVLDALASVRAADRDHCISYLLALDD